MRGGSAWLTPIGLAECIHNEVMKPKVATGWEGALWGVAGLFIGGVAVFFALSSGTQDAPVATVQRPPVVEQPETGAPPEQAPDSLMPPVEPTTAPTVPTGPSAPAGATPPAPATRPGPAMGGTLPFGPPPTGGNAPLKVDVPDASIRTQEVQLSRLNVYTSEGSAARDEILAFAKSKGGQVRTFVDYGNAEQVPSDGLLVMLSDKEADALVQYVMSKNANVAEQRYRTAPAARQARIQDEAQSALFALKAKRQKLLVRFLEDAGPVKQVEEDIAIAEAAIQRLRIPEEQQSLAAVKVTFGPRG